MNEEIQIKNKDRYKLDSIKAYNRYQERYDDIFWMKVFSVEKWDESVLDELQNDIGELHILDIGCATGRLLEQFAKAGATNLYGTDIAVKMLKVVEERLEEYDLRFELKAADVETQLPWTDELFDVVTLTGAIHHLYSPDDALKEIYRVLKREGRLIVLEPRFIVVYRQLLNLYLRIFMHDGDYKFYSPRSLAKLVCNSGFKVEKSDVKVGWLAYKAIFRK